MSHPGRTTGARPAVGPGTRVGDSRPAWVVRDGNYVSARWPGDVHTFAHTFAQLFC